LTVLIGLAYDSISEKKADWMARRKVVLHVIGGLRSWAKQPPFEPPMKKIEDTSITPPTPSFIHTRELIQNLAITGVLVFRPTRF